MFKGLFPVLLLTILTVQPAYPLTLKEFDEELQKGTLSIHKEIQRLGDLLDKLPQSDINHLNTTYIGDESMTEADILIMSSDQILAGISNMAFYLNHRKDEKNNDKK